MQQLQKIIFPASSGDAPSLYFRHETPMPAHGGAGVRFPRWPRVTFDTYWNMFSLRTWKRHTHIRNIFLEAVFQGPCVIRLYALGDDDTRKLLDERAFDGEEERSVSLRFPKTTAPTLFWTLESGENFHLRESWYATDAPETAARKINLAVIFCTYKREDYIRQNVAMFSTLASEYPETAGAVSLHIVDNGRTLPPDAFSGRDVTLYPNPNTGGSGGFARGMLEVLDAGEATHALLMDDDLSFLPESMFRTFSFLRLCKEAYHGHFLGGDMMDSLWPGILYESVAGWDKNRLWVNPRHGLDLTERKSCLQNASPFRDRDIRPYQGWWYCAIPVQNIRKYGFPYPFFVRQDDIEFAIRQEAGVLRLNGICVSHEPFCKKDNNFTWYLILRNLLIFSALYPDAAAEGLIIRKKWIRDFFQAALTGNYAKALALAGAVEDFLRGPAFLRDPATGEAVLRAQAENKGDVKPLRAFRNEGIPENLDILRHASPCSLAEKILCALTLNGTLLPPVFRREKGFALLGENFQLRNYLFRKSVLVLNPYAGTAELRVISLRNFIRVFLRTAGVALRYLQQRRALRKQYRGEFAHMISREFWMEHLGLSRTQNPLAGPDA